ncbi:hypothetical protein [Thalassobacillus sp. CUG 92003]|uniref:hypothetical protein n=1 Tax=Thalassobacillus sp. CUG 92003 TaxID=2736641 RepID=UPI0015E71F01|nr:hypothetical protein [Thalassobacillus sp. CUG 92003]
MKYRTAQEIKKLLLEDHETVVNQIDAEKIDVYMFLHHRFQNTRASHDPMFQFVFRYFYKLDNPSLTNEFEQRYFEIMDELHTEEKPNIMHIVRDLYEVKNHKGNPTMQFPLAASMLHTLNAKFPTYDSDVAKAFDFSSTYHLSGFDKKMKRYIEQYMHTFTTYQELLEDEAIRPVLNHFDERFLNNGLSNVKKIDLIVGQLGHNMQ